MVQRQWDVVSPFRSQIIHKATLSLREVASSAEDVCATLVTLHLLDSRPVNETLSTLLQQRSHTLKTVLSWPPDPKPEDKVPKSVINGATHSISVREVTQLMKNTLNVISHTICTARRLFDRKGEDRSLIFVVLFSTQSEPENFPSNLPTELQLSTQTLLSQLTSSVNFQLLPYDVRSYKPYINLESSSASLTQSIYSSKLQEWFTSSCGRWQSSASQWLSCLATVKDVWTVKTSFKRFLSTSGLDEQEKFQISSNADGAFHKRILEIWQRAIDEAQNLFKTRLSSSDAPKPNLGL